MERSRVSIFGSVEWVQCATQTDSYILRSSAKPDVLLLQILLRSYEPGMGQTISYDPRDPADFEANLDPVATLKVSLFVVGLGVFFILGGVVVYRWSLRATD